jgi:hypothetical protein
MQSTQKLKEINWNSTKQLISSKNQVYIGLFFSVPLEHLICQAASRCSMNAHDKQTSRVLS